MAKNDNRFCEQFETYTEMVDHVAQRVHGGLLEKGGKGLRDEIYLWLGQAINIGKEQAAAERKKK